MTGRVALLTYLVLGLAICWADPARSQTLPGTKPWSDRGDPARAMVEGLHRFADRETRESVKLRKEHWTIDASSPEAYVKSIEPNRKRFERMIGATGTRVAPVELSYVSSPDSPAKVAEGNGVSVFAVRWTVYPGFEAEGLLLVPDGEIRADLVAIPDSSSSPEAFAGLAPGTENALAYHLARQGLRVLIPTLIDRTDEFSGNPRIRMTNLPHREWIHRMAYETGRTLIGYEVDEVRSAVDWFQQTGKPGRPIGVVGHGEGGLIAFYAAAIDPRIEVAWVAGYYGPREQLWREPIDRNVWGLLTEFGDAEIAGLVITRSLIVQPCKAPEVAGPPRPRNGRNDASPGVIATPDAEDASEEWVRINDVVSKELLPGLTSSKGSGSLLIAEYEPVSLKPRNSESIASTEIPARGFLERLKIDGPPVGFTTTLRDLRPSYNPRARMKRLVGQLVEYTQGVIRTSETRRYADWSKVDRSSPEAWTKSVEPLRKEFQEELIGKLAEPYLPLEAKTVPLFDEPKWTGYAVELPVLPDVVASGILLLPKDLQAGEKRPVVVCQHGLEGRPEDVCDPKIKSVYRSFGAQLADRGYIVYAPQNPYIGEGRFRTLQRKLNPLKQSLFSVIVAQHEQTLRWLATRPEVDPDRIAFYGLSYGGKTAMRVPAILGRYCLSICSGDFNEWVVKNTSVDRPESYMYTYEYDMYEFGLAEKFNYAEMAALIAPRPFMVERGHKDGVGTDELIGYEFAKVKRTYDFLNLSDRVEIAYFNDGHRIDGAGTFPFLARHLNWPRGR
jgi:dienelactone hydrolase